MSSLKLFVLPYTTLNATDYYTTHFWSEISPQKNFLWTFPNSVKFTLHILALYDNMKVAQYNMKHLLCHCGYLGSVKESGVTRGGDSSVVRASDS